MTEADKLNSSPNNGNDNNKLMESIGAANSLDLRRDGYGRAYGVQQNDSQVHLRDYWRIVRRRLWVPISVVLLTVTLVTIYMLRSPSIFEGQTTIQLDREDTASLDVNSKELKIMGPEDTQYINTQLKNIQSPTTAFKVTKVLDLEHNLKFAPKGGREALKNDVIVTSGGDEQQADRNRLEPYVEALLANVDISRLRDTRLIQVKYKHTDRELAKKITVRPPSLKAAIW